MTPVPRRRKPATLAAAQGSASDSSAAANAVAAATPFTLDPHALGADLPAKPGRVLPAAVAAPAATTTTAATFAPINTVSSFLSELDEIVDGVFARYKFLEVLGTWFVILLSDASVNFPLEWVVFCFLSLFSYYRAFQTHLQLLFVFSILIAMLDMLTYIILIHYTSPGWLPTIANMMVFGYMVCSVRGFDAVSWMMWLVFVSYDVFGRRLVIPGHFEPLAVHCVGYGFYLMATESAQNVYHAS